MNLYNAPVHKDITRTCNRKRDACIPVAHYQAHAPIFPQEMYVYIEERYVGGIVYFTVLCDHPYLVSLLFAVLVSLHPVTILITCLCHFF